MNKNIRLATAGAVLAAAASLTTAANAATAAGTASAEILSALSVAETSGLAFGQIAVNGAGTVTVATGATPVDVCTANLVCAGTKAPAVFTVTGAPGIGVTASVQETSINLTSGANTMVLNNFTLYWPNGTTLSAAGTRQFNVGGTLAVGNGQATGTYTGTYNVNVAYN